jgi:uncharacterized protein (TIGR03435 family)
MKSKSVWAPRIDALGMTMPGPLPQRIRRMLSGAPAERFGLKVHREQKELSIYALTVAKKGPKLKPAAGEMDKLPDGTTLKKRTLMFTVPRKPDGKFDERKRQIIVRNESIQGLANTLSTASSTSHWSMSQISRTHPPLRGPLEIPLG